MRTLKIINASSRQVAYRTIGELITGLEELRSLSVFPKKVKNIHNNLNAISGLKNRQEIIENLNLIHYYDDIAKRLVSIKSQLTYAFKDSPDYKATYKLVQDINKELIKSTSDIMKALHKYCWANTDTKVKAKLTTIQRLLSTKYKGKFFMLLDAIKLDSKDRLVHRFYIRLDNVADDTGFTYPHYYIMLTLIGNTWFINTGAFFRLIRFNDPGDQIKGDLLKAIRDTMNKDGI